MTRLATVFWLFVVVVAAFMLYRVKYEVQSLQSQIVATSKQLEQEREALHVVAAEWAYLNRPERLQQLSAKYLNLQPSTVQQIADLQALPYPMMASNAAPNPGLQPASLKKR